MRDITVAGHLLRVSASPVNFTITVFELPDRISPAYLGHIVGVEIGMPELHLAEDAAWAAPRLTRDTIRAATLGFWRQVRNDYLRSLGTLGLAVLSAPVIDGRVLRLCRLPGQSRIRVTFASVRPHYVGIVADLDTAEPRFIGAAEHLDWAKTAGHIRCILNEAVLAYAHRDRADLSKREMSESPDSVV